MDSLLTVCGWLGRAAPWVQLSVSAGNWYLHNALRHHWLMPVSCPFRDCKSAASHESDSCKRRHNKCPEWPLPLPNVGLNRVTVAAIFKRCFLLFVYDCDIFHVYSVEQHKFIWKIHKLRSYSYAKRWLGSADESTDSADWAIGSAVNFAWKAKQRTKYKRLLPRHVLHQSF